MTSILSFLTLTPLNPAPSRPFPFLTSIILLPPIPRYLSSFLLHAVKTLLCAVEAAKPQPEPLPTGRGIAAWARQYVNGTKPTDLPCVR